VRFSILQAMPHVFAIHLLFYYIFQLCFELWKAFFRIESMFHRNGHVMREKIKGFLIKVIVMFNCWFERYFFSFCYFKIFKFLLICATSLKFWSSRTKILNFLNFTQANDFERWNTIFWIYIKQIFWTSNDVEIALTNLSNSDGSFP